jgi:hypothetical protein
MAGLHSTEESLMFALLFGSSAVAWRPLIDLRLPSRPCLSTVRPGRPVHRTADRKSARRQLRYRAE